MQLTAENYYSQEANREYMSVSQLKDFVGTYGPSIRVIPAPHTASKLNTWSQGKLAEASMLLGQLRHPSGTRGVSTRSRLGV